MICDCDVAVETETA